MTIELTLLSRVRCRGVEITGARLHGLLALLAQDPRGGCGAARLIAALWPDDQPEHPSKALQVLVSRARSRVGADVIVSTPTGYRLALAENEIDACAVVAHATAAARFAGAGDHPAALDAAEAGLALFAEAEQSAAGDDPLSALRAARASTRQSLVRARALALSRLGRRAEAAEPLAELVAAAPRDEEVLAEALRCEAATAGPSAALARYDAYRGELRDELGTDPGADVQNVYQELLRADTPVVRRGVRHEPNPLLGRDADVVAVTAMLRSSRVTSIVGPGGLGKTRLAHVVGRQAEQRIVHFVALAGVGTDADVAGEVASALGVGETAAASVSRHAVAPDVVSGIVGALGAGPVLLVLDNCEHVVRGAADLVQALVSWCRDLRVLTTSRAPLGLSSESVYLLPQLNLPTMVELFRQRAEAARPGVDLPETVVRELCDRLDGLPLAVELAAARVRVLSVVDIARRLDDRFTVLRGGARDAPRRHRTLHDVIDWSWHLLEPGARRAMCVLSVFPGGCTANAARAVLGGDVLDVLDVLEQLVDQSLLKVTDTGSGTRFRMLETVREFSAARGHEIDESDGAIDRFLEWARDFGLAHHERLFGPDVVPAMRDVRVEQDNLLRAQRYALDREDGPTVAATAAALGGLWILESNFTRLAGLASDTAWTLSHYRPAPAHVEATRAAAVLCATSSMLMRSGRPLRALVVLRRLPPAPADTLARAIQIVLCTAVEGGLAAVEPLCDSEEPLLAGMADAAVSFALEASNDLDGAYKAARRMLTALENYSIPWIRAVAHSRIGELCLQIGPADEAVRHLGIALSIVEQIGALHSAVRGQWALVFACLRAGAIDDAEHWLEQASRNDGVEAAGLEMVDSTVRAEILLARGDVDAGLRLWRHVAGRLRDSATVTAYWRTEVLSATVVAHAQHGRLDLIENITDPLPQLTATALSTMEFPACGALLLALAVVRADRGAGRSAARLVALAERFRYARSFQPTMSVDRARQAAVRADGPAYTEAVSTYADLDPNALRAAAVGEVTAPGSA